MLGIYSLGNSPIYQTPLQNLTCRPKEGNKKERKKQGRKKIDKKDHENAKNSCRGHCCKETLDTSTHHRLVR